MPFVAETQEKESYRLLLINSNASADTRVTVTGDPPFSLQIIRGLTGTIEKEITIDPNSNPLTPIEISPVYRLVIFEITKAQAKKLANSNRPLDKITNL